MFAGCKYNQRDFTYQRSDNYSEYVVDILGKHNLGFGVTDNGYGGYSLDIHGKY